MSLHIRRTFPLLITGVMGLMMVGGGFFADKEMKSLENLLLDWSVIISAFAICLGGANLVAIHGKEIRKRTPGKWYYSATLLFVLLLYVVLGLMYTTSGGLYQWLFGAINFPLSQMTFTLLAFYGFSSAVRAFQARNWEATIFVLCALFVVIGNIPSTSLLSPELAGIGTWITDVPSKGALRGLLVTAAVGGIYMAFRTIMGRETGYLGRV